MRDHCTAQTVEISNPLRTQEGSQIVINMTNESLTKTLQGLVILAKMSKVPVKLPIGLNHYTLRPN